MTRPFTFTLMDYLEARCSELGLKVPDLEWLTPEGYSIAVIQNDAPSIEKSYINGSNQYRCQYEIIAQGSTAERLTILEDMQLLATVFNGMVGNDIGDGTAVRKVELTTPSLREQTDSLHLRYGFAVTIVYKD